jgi:peptidoglycan/xylan/chitin deacetylase (PgdA/CDA1 family)
MKAVVNWDYDTQDWMYGDNSNTATTIFDAFNETIIASNPALDSFIVLMHEFMIVQGTINVPKYVKAAEDKGYRIVTMSECLGLSSQWQ